jgi:hypothetical protein
MLQKPTFVFTTLRDPAARIMSSFYFFYKANSPEPTLTNKLDHLKRTKFQNFMFHYMKSDDSLGHVNSSKCTLAQNASQNRCNMKAEVVMRSYDFIAIAELMDESWVLLAYILNIPLSHVLYLDAKVAGAYEPRTQHVTKAHPKLVEEPKQVQEYLQNEFKIRNAMDYMIYAKARKQITDAYNEIPGLKRNLTIFKELRVTADLDCGKLKYNEDECLWNDNGCGHECMNNRFKVTIDDTVRSSLFS